MIFILKQEEKETKKQLVIIGIFIILIVGLTGCNENKVVDVNKFIGTWVGTSNFENGTLNVTLEFYDDKTAKQTTEGFHIHWFTFEIDENSLYLTLQEFPDYDPMIYNYEFSNNNNDLTLTNEEMDTLILTKQ